MTLTELLAHVGDDHIKFQTLLGSATGAKHRKGGVEVSFMTDQISVADVGGFTTPDVLALVVYLPRDRLPAQFKS